MTYKLLESKAIRLLKQCKRNAMPQWAVEHAQDMLNKAKYFRGTGDAREYPDAFTKACNILCYAIDMLSAFVGSIPQGERKT